jgi:hypothetical protein
MIQKRVFKWIVGGGFVFAVVTGLFALLTGAFTFWGSFVVWVFAIMSTVVFMILPVTLIVLGIIKTMTTKVPKKP